MPSLPHEGLIDLIRKRPATIAELLAGPLKLNVPKFQCARLLPADLPEVTPTEFRADGVVAYYDSPEDEKPTFAVVFEAQRQTDQQKRLSWPVYVATAHARHDCPTALLVWCETRAVAKWAAEPISTGDPGLQLTPVALGPDQMPVIPMGPTATRHPHLTVFSTASHINGQHAEIVVESLASVLGQFEREEALTYLYMIAALATPTKRPLLEKIMTTAQVPFEDFARFVLPETFAKGEAAGEAKGEAKAVLAILDARRVAVPDDVRMRITTCTNIEQLDTWIARAANADKIDDLFV